MNFCKTIFYNTHIFSHRNHCLKSFLPTWHAKVHIWPLLWHHHPDCVQCFFSWMPFRVMSWVSPGSIRYDRWSIRWMAPNWNVDNRAVMDIKNMQSVCRYHGNLFNTITCSSCVPSVGTSMSNNSKLIHQILFELNCRMLHFCVCGNYRIHTWDYSRCRFLHGRWIHNPQWNSKMGLIHSNNNFLNDQVIPSPTNPICELRSWCPGPVFYLCLRTCLETV